MPDCDGWLPRLREWCTKKARWSIYHRDLGPSHAFLRCGSCARSYRRYPRAGFICERLAA